MKIRSQIRLLFDCTWFTVTILLKQTGREPSSSHKVRFVLVLLSISATYVITDMYSANLTSLLAKPGREKAIHNLYDLEKAMEIKKYNLYVERHSSSYKLLENGTGVYSRLWELMERQQDNFAVNTVEEGVKKVRDSKNGVLMAGRETLYFEIQRFGASNFFLSEKLNTAYSAIAFQLGCPYIEEFNRILMAIFEGGIITKMTEDEYKKLGKEKEVSSEDADVFAPDAKKDSRRQTKMVEDSEKLKPLSLKMLQGAFYLLCIGNATSGIILLIEILFHRHQRKLRRERKRRMQPLKTKISEMGRWMKDFGTSLIYDAFMPPFEYVD
ncbi:unnamed protein product [Acanthoscelides obtectus]|nr:unnamed protein product [Acanthoscelides obtectus]CAK1641824.1 Ionotropic receptor 40a [Acanthoscelides obtectus]